VGANYSSGLALLPRWAPIRVTGTKRGRALALAKRKLLRSTVKSQKPGTLPSPGILSTAHPRVFVRLPPLKNQRQ